MFYDSVKRGKRVILNCFKDANTFNLLGQTESLWSCFRLCEEKKVTSVKLVDHVNEGKVLTFDAFL